MRSVEIAQGVLRLTGERFRLEEEIPHWERSVDAPALEAFKALSSLL